MKVFLLWIFSALCVVANVSPQHLQQQYQRENEMVVQHALKFSEALKGTFAGHFADKKTVMAMYDEKSVLTFESEFPFGGTFEGEDIALFYKRLSLTLDISNLELALIGINEATGMALLETRLTAVITRSNKPVVMRLVHAIEFNQLTGKIMTHLVANKDIAKTIPLYRTEAENNLGTLITTMFKSDPEAVLDGTAPVWNLFSDSIKVKVNAYPMDLWEGKMEWNGKQELFDHMKEAHTKAETMKYVFMKDLATKVQKMELKVLFSDVHEVYAKIETNVDGLPDTLRHYTFDNQGKLASAEITFLGPLYAQHIYPLKLKQPETEMDKSQMHGQMHSGGSFANSVKTGDIKEFYQVGHINVDSKTYTLNNELEVEMNPALKSNNP